MSAAVLGSLRRRRRRAPARTSPGVSGRDFARTPSRPRARLGAAAWIAAIATALALVALRVDLLRTRYALSQAIASEQALREDIRELTVHMRELRDPRRLSEIARERGFAPAERLIELPLAGAADPAPGTAARDARPAAAGDATAGARP